jgi:hypothetical protein
LLTIHELGWAPPAEQQLFFFQGLLLQATPKMSGFVFIGCLLQTERAVPGHITVRHGHVLLHPRFGVGPKGASPLTADESENRKNYGCT